MINIQTQTVTSLQVRAMMNSPQKLMRFHTTGQLPRERSAPVTPLLELINSIPMREWHKYECVNIDRSLGFNGSRQFATLHQAATWLGRHAILINNQRMTFQSWMISGFNKKLTIEDLCNNCKKHP